MSKEINLFKELYGKRVQMNDRFESVHIWSEEVALINAGRWTPILIEKLACDVCGSTEVIEAPPMGINCNRCHPI